MIDLLEDKDLDLAFEAWKYLHVTTGQPAGDEVLWNDFDAFNPQPVRPELVAAWRKFWKENGDVLRPRRAVNFGM